MRLPSSLLVLLVALLPATGCVQIGSRTPLQVATVVRQAEREVRGLMAGEDWVGATRLADALRRVEPDLAVYADLAAARPAEIDALFDRGLLGANAALRPAREASVGRRLLYWLPDRLLDLFDVVSFDVAVGPGVWVDAHLTRWASFGLGGRATIGAGWHEGRNLGIRVLAEQGFSVPAYTYGSLYGFTHGTGPSRLGAEHFAGCPCTQTTLHADWRDPWALGVEAHALLVGASVAVHPLQIVDLVTGLVGYDLLDDDLATTRATPDLPREAFLHLQTLAEMAMDEETLRDYAAYKAEQAAEALAAPGDGEG